MNILLHQAQHQIHTFDSYFLLPLLYNIFKTLTYQGSRDTFPYIFNLGTRRMWVVSFISGSLSQGKTAVVSSVYVFWKEQHCRTFHKMFTRCESPQEQETVAKSRLRVGDLLLVFRLKQHLRSWHQNMWQYTWLIYLELSINWVILKHTALETVCVSVCVCVCVCACACLSLDWKEKAEFYIFVSVRMNPYISEFVRMSKYIFLIPIILSPYISEFIRMSQNIFESFRMSKYIFLSPFILSPYISEFVRMCQFILDSVRINKYIFESVRMIKYIFESVSMNHSLSLDMPTLRKRIESLCL